MFGSLGIPELLIIGVIVVLLFGPSQVPKFGRALGETIREFRGVRDELQKGWDDADRK